MISTKILFIWFIIIVSLQIEGDIYAQRKPSRNPTKKVDNSSTKFNSTKNDRATPPRKTTPPNSNLKGRSDKRPTRPTPNKMGDRKRKDAEIDDSRKDRNLKLIQPKRPPRQPTSKPKPIKRKHRPERIGYKGDHFECESNNYIVDYYYDSQPFCEVIYDEIKLRYPAFPLRFLDAEINYLYSEERKYTRGKHIITWNSRQFSSTKRDIYEMNISIRVRKFSYCEMFGVLLQFPDGVEKLILYNEEELCLYDDNVYIFSKEITLHKTGYVTLILGYYDSFNYAFYPANGYGKKTEILIYVDKCLDYSSSY